MLLLTMKNDELEFIENSVGVPRIVTVIQNSAFSKWVGTMAPSIWDLLVYWFTLCIGLINYKSQLI